MSNLNQLQASECERVIIGCGDRVLGMSLRDYFAASCMGNSYMLFIDPVKLAEKAYEIADAMMKARDAAR